MPPVEQAITEFGKHGIDGLVILALFLLVIYVLYQVKFIIDASDERFDKQSNMHAEERKEVNVLVRDLTKVVHTLSTQFEARLR